MKASVRCWVLMSCLFLMTGCATGNIDTFTLTAELPPGFSYTAIAVYTPAKGESCKVPGGKGTKVYFNSNWRKQYQQDSQISIQRAVKGCVLVLDKVNIEINAIYHAGISNFSRDSALIAVDYSVEEKYKWAFDPAGESTISGQCQWLFRTLGPKRVIRKILDCKNIDNQGQVGKGRPFVAHALDQLPGKTIKIKIRLADDEVPAIGDTWVKVSSGWKRCMGESFEDQHAFCYGNFKDFSTFLLPDGTSCSIYPGCIE